METLKNNASLIARIQAIINTTDMTDVNEIIALAVEQERVFLEEMIAQKTERSKNAFKTMMKKVYCANVLKS
jgi:hypothetical protein